MYVVQLCTYLDLADFLFSFLFFSWHIAFRWEVVGNKGPSCLLLVHECERTRSTLLTCIYIISKNQKRGTLFVPKTVCISLSLYVYSPSMCFPNCLLVLGCNWLCLLLASTSNSSHLQRRDAYGRQR